MRHVRAVLMAVALSAVAVMPVKGDWGPPAYPYYSGGNSFATVASIEVKYLDYTLAGGYYEIQVTVINKGLYGEVFKAIGLINVPPGLTFDAANSSGPNTNWVTPANELGGAGLPDGTYAFKTKNEGPTNGIQPNGSGYFVFKLDVTGLTDHSLVQQIGVGIHAISGPSGCSTKLGVINGEVIDNADPDSYASCGSTTVPEPSTVVLLGTGLIGLLGVAYRRRRDED